ncbi:hypothetical protein GGQ84_000498 [Desulfitispora alkaliphila]|uniref:hypothetical protein n=1 Tax=Desulfitispora alkaliphila TaxID=622674 RepID=UPI003D1CE7E4
MEKQTEVMTKAIELSRTGLEGLEHIHKKTIEGQFEETAILFKDVFHAFTEVEQAIKPIIPELDENEIEPLTASLIEGFKLMLAAYEKEENMRPVEVMQFTLLPRYKKWQAELEKSFAKYTAS